MKRSNQGFTLIELIIVIVILGILAVTASPKFLDLTADARASTVEGLEGTVRGAANIAYSKALVQGADADLDGDDDGTADAENDTADISLVNDYPDVQATGITRMIEQDGFTVVLNNGTAASATEVRYYPEGVTAGDADASFTDGAACYVTYTNAATGAAPVINSVTTDCD